MADDITPVYVGQRKPVEQWTWTRGDGTHPDLVTGAPVLSLRYLSTAGLLRSAGTGAFGGQTIGGVFTYARSAVDVATSFVGRVQFTITYSDGTTEISDPYPYEIL